MKTRQSVNEFNRTMAERLRLYQQSLATRMLIQDSEDAMHWEREVRKAKLPVGVLEILRAAWNDFRARWKRHAAK